MSPTLNGNTALQRFERSNAVEIRDGMFDFYPGLPYVIIVVVWSTYIIIYVRHNIANLTTL